MEHVQDQLPAGFSSQMGPFAIVPIWIFEHELKPVELKVWISIRSFCGSNGVCWPKATSIAERAHVSVSAVHNSVSSLRTKDLLKTRQKRRVDGSVAYLIYTVPDLDPAKYAVTALETNSHKGTSSNEEPATTSRNKASSLVETGSSFEEPATTSENTTFSQVATGYSNEEGVYLKRVRQEVIKGTNQKPSSSGASYRDRIAVLTGADDDGIDLVIDKIKSSTKKPVRNLGALIRSISDQDIVDHHASLAPAPKPAVMPVAARRCPAHPGATSWPCSSCAGDVKAGEDPFKGREDRPVGWFEAHPLALRLVEREPAEPEPVWVSPVFDAESEDWVTEGNAGGDCVESPVSESCTNPMCRDGYINLGASGRRPCRVCGGPLATGKPASVASVLGSFASSFGGM